MFGAPSRTSASRSQGSFGKKTHGDVEGRPAPAFEREYLRQGAGIGAGDAGNIMRTHARGEQRLVAVSHAGIGKKHPVFRTHPGSEFLRAERIEALLRARTRLIRAIGNHGRRRFRVRAGAITGLGMAVDAGIGEIVQQPGRPVLPLDLGETVPASRR